MKSPSALTLRPCIVVALELLGLDSPFVPRGSARHAIEILDQSFGDQKTRAQPKSRLIVSGHRAICVTPVQAPSTPLYFELLRLAYLQRELLFLEVLLRGAITYGGAAATESSALGPALIEAERLRDECAEVPRIVVDPRLVLAVETNAELRAAHHNVPQSLAFLRQLLREDTDGLWFVDSLRINTQAPEEPFRYLEFFHEHCQVVERRLNAATKLDHASRGYTWLRSYHNRVIDELVEEKRLDEAERSRLRIPATSPLVYAFPPSAIKP